VAIFMNNSIKHKTFLGITAVALLYVLLAKLGLFFALPPGYATFFWPASGLAFAAVYLGGYRYCIGVFIGAFLANIMNFIGESPSHFIDPIVAFNAVSIATGTTLQSCIGALVVRRYIGEQTGLFKFQEIVLFCFLAGPLVCFISASWGVFSLWATDVISSENAVFSWLTWYVGDILGVLIVSPVIVLMFAKTHVTPMRKYSVGVPMLLVFCLVMGSFIAMRDIDQDEKIRTFEAQTKQISLEIEEKILISFSKMNAMRAHFLSSDDVNNTEFNRFATSVIFENAEANGYKSIKTYNHSIAFIKKVINKNDAPSGIVIKSLEGGKLIPSDHDCTPFCAVVEYRYPDS